MKVTLDLPEGIVKRIDQLTEIVNANDKRNYIRTEDAAHFVGMDPESYRIAALRGAVPFAIGYRRDAKANACVRTAILPFYLKMMNINGQDIITAMEDAK